MSDSNSRTSVVFVCTGNICRSPMAEKVLLGHLRVAGLASQVRVTSAGTHGWHVGDRADYRTERVLRDAGYETSHRAAQFGPSHSDAELIVALDAGHARTLRRLGYREPQLRLLRSFDPTADSDDCADPYYGDYRDFEKVREEIEAAIPGILDWIRERLG